MRLLRKDCGKPLSALVLRSTSPVVRLKKRRPGCEAPALNGCTDYYKIREDCGDAICGAICASSI